MALFSWGCGGTGNDKQQTAESQAASRIEPAEEIYIVRCSACHGNDGSAGIGGATNLQTSRSDTTKIDVQIKNGGKGMPAFKEVLTDAEISLVKKYVLTLRK